ncbi:hypothetical protein ADUPG1_005564, partial [Aduncisulcus paluster]
MSECPLTASISDLSTMSSVVYLDLSNSSDISYVTDITGFESMESIETMYLSGWSGISSLPWLDNSIATLNELDISRTGIKTLGPIEHQASTLTTLTMDSCD